MLLFVVTIITTVHMFRQIELGEQSNKVFNREWLLTKDNDNYSLLNIGTKLSYPINEYLHSNYNVNNIVDITTNAPNTYASKFVRLPIITDIKLVIIINNDYICFLEYCTEKTGEHKLKCPVNKVVSNYVDEYKVIIYLTKIKFNKEHGIEIVDQRTIDSDLTVIGDKEMYFNCPNDNTIILSFNSIQYSLRNKLINVKLQNYVTFINMDNMHWDTHFDVSLNYKLLQRENTSISCTFGDNNAFINVYDYWNKYQLVPINFVNNMCTVYDLKTRQYHYFTGQLALKYNKCSDDYIYYLTNDKKTTLIEFEKTRRTNPLDEYKFSVQTSKCIGNLNSVTLIATNDFGEMFSGTNYYSEAVKGINDVGLIRLIVQNAIDNITDELSLSWEKINDKKMIATINVSNEDIMEALTFKMEHVQYDIIKKISSLEKKIAYLMDQ